MIVLKILGIVLASVIGLVLLVILLICAIRVNILGETDSDHFLLTVKVLFFKITLPKPEAPGEEQEKPAPKKKEKPKKEEKKPKKKKKKKTKLFDRWYMPGPMTIVRKIGWLLRLIPGVLAHTRIHLFRLYVVCGGTDPAELAMSYGSLCAAVYPITGYLQTTSQVDGDAMDVDLQCDFDAEATETDFAFHISLRGGYAIWALLRVLLH